MVGVTRAAGSTIRLAARASSCTPQGISTKGPGSTTKQTDLVFIRPQMVRDSKGTGETIISMAKVLKHSLGEHSTRESTQWATKMGLVNTLT